MIAVTLLLLTIGCYSRPPRDCHLETYRALEVEYPFIWKPLYKNNEEKGGWVEIWRTQCWRIPQYDSTLKVHSIRLSSSLRENVIFREGDKKFFHRKQISERRDMTGVINFINDSFLAVCPDKNIYLHPKKFKKTLLHKRTLESGKGNVSFFVIPVIEQVLDWYDWTLDYELDFFDDEFFENTSLLSEEIVRIKRQRIEEINRQIRLRNVQASLIEKKQEKTEPVLTQPAKFEPVKI